MNYEFTKANTVSDLKWFYPTIKQLRSELSYEDYLSMYEKAHINDGYELLAITRGEEVFAVIGYRILYDFVHGKHVYIDDLITAELHRAKGFGTKLLSHVEGIAKTLCCTKLRLCTGIKNELGKKFYEKQDWDLKAVVYKK